MKEQVLEKWEQFEAWFHALTLRERAIMALGTAAALGVLWFVMFLEPAMKANARFEGIQLSKQKEISALKVKQAEITALMAVDPNVEVKEKIKRLAQLDAGLDRQVKELAASWVTPEQMANALRNVLGRRGNLRLVSLTSEAPKSLSESGRSGGGARGSAGIQQDIFVHGMELVLEGKFFDVLQYLEELERSPWNFFWDTLDYSVKEFPQASVKLRVKTYSANRAWIGV